MKIGIDVRALEGGGSAQHRGIGRFATSLIEALGTLDDKNDYVFFTSHSKTEAPTFKLPPSFKRNSAHGKPPGLRNVKYIRIAYLLPRPLAVDAYGLDVFLQLDVFHPIKAKKTPVVSILYDLIPFLFPEMYQYVHRGGYTPGHLIGYSRLKLRWKLLEKLLVSYQRSTKVISISEHSKKDLLAMFPAIKSRDVVVAPLAGDLPAPPPKKQPALAKKISKPFLFYVGGADPRKGLVHFTENLEDLWKKHPSVSFLIAGKEIVAEDVPEAIKLKNVAEASSRPQQIVRMGFISDEDLAWAYANAAAFVFPSTYEGFGLPVLEAMQAGCPAVAYNTSSIPEVAGTAAVLVPSGESMVPAIDKILSNEDYRQKLIVKGKKQAQKFTWVNTALITLDTLQKAAKEGRKK